RQIGQVQNVPGAPCRAEKVAAERFQTLTNIAGVRDKEVARHIVETALDAAQEIQPPYAASQPVLVFNLQRGYADQLCVPPGQQKEQLLIGCDVLAGQLLHPANLVAVCAIAVEILQ